MIILYRLYFYCYLKLNGSVRPVPPPRDHLRIEKDGRLVNRSPAPQVPDRKITTTLSSTNQLPQLHTSPNNNQIAQIVEPTSEQLISIKKYEVSAFLFVIHIIFLYIFTPYIHTYIYR